MGLIKDLKTKHDIQVQHLRCNNAGEKVDFMRVCKQEGMGMEFKYIAPGAPQQYGHVELKFATLFNQVHAMLSSKKFSAFLKTAYGPKPSTPPLFLKIIL